jgi:hypothetical protein
MPMNKRRFLKGDYVRELDGNAIGIIIHIMKDCGLVVVKWPPSREGLAFHPEDLVKVRPNVG